MNKSLSLTKRVRIDSVLNILIKIDAIAKMFGLHKAIATFLLLAIRVYKKYLSPHKGFNCAHRVLHQGQSCSSYFYSCITEQSLSMACLSFQQRLQDCQQAHAILIASDKRQGLRNKRRRRNSTCAENNNCIDCRDIFNLEFFLDLLLGFFLDLIPPCNC